METTDGGVSMATLTLTPEQVIDLVEQLSPDDQQVLLNRLLTRHSPTWIALSQAGAAGVRAAAAQRGRDWDTMSEAEREAFIDDVVHEDR
jgi:hypothetical protein